MTARRVGFGVLAAAAIILVLGRWSTGLYTDYLWYASLGAASVWRARVATTAVLWVGSFAIASLFAFVNLYAVRRSVVSLVLPRRIANVEIGEEVPGRLLLLAASLLSCIVGVALVLPASAWTRALLPQIGQPFGETDPYFGADVGFFVYWLPFEITLHEWTVILLAVVVALVVLLYALTPSLRWERGHLYVSAYVRRHFMILGGVLLLVLAWSYRLDMYRLVAMGEGTGGVFTAVDHRVLVPSTLLLSVVTFCAAIVVCWAGWSGQMRLAFLAVTTVILLSVIARSVAPLLARRSVDPAAAAAQELPYIATRHTYTRRAYGVDRMRPDTLGAGFASAADAARHVAIWDGETLAAAAQRQRRVRIVGSGAGWQANGGSLTALLVERSSEAISDRRDAWGIGRFDPTTADERGMPVRLTGSGRGLDETLFGEPAVFDSAPSYSVISDSLGRVAGVEMVSTRSRMAHAWALQNYRLLFGELPLDRPMIVQRRDVRDRVRHLVPFFVQGSDVLPLVADDSLYWVVELYAASASYPLSERFVLLGDERGYLQHAATALIDAASGRVRIVLDPSPDPVASSWASRFPRMFVPVASLPAPLQAALPPITDGAHAQGLAFATAGFRGDSLELRHFATLDGADSAASREPLHFVLPSGELAAGWTLLDARDRVRGLVAAEGGPQRITAWIPLLSGDERWGTVIDQLRGADTTAHDNGVVRAPARVVPVGGHPVYFQSVFQWLPGGTPRLVHVSTVAGDSVTVAPTLAAVFGGQADAESSSAAAPPFRVRADSLYRAMRAALERGDWTSFGRAFDALGAALRRPAP
ncbi:MAG TPA: UPF0182 family protein [Gemmatimonadaceae bacterium]|nr:UPF0182 family protein [Gemmatimonadaceae bacterium]